MKQPRLYLSKLTGSIYVAETNASGKVIGEKHDVSSDFLKVLELMYPVSTVAAISADGKDRLLLVTALPASEVIIDGEVLTGSEWQHQKLSQEGIEHLRKCISSEISDYLMSIEHVGAPETINELYRGLVKRTHLMFQRRELISLDKCEATS